MGMDCGAVKERMEMGSAEEGKEMVSLEALNARPPRPFAFASHE